jgi:hypothetical protein
MNHMSCRTAVFGGVGGASIELNVFGKLAL